MTDGPHNRQSYVRATLPVDAGHDTYGLGKERRIVIRISREEAFRLIEELRAGLAGFEVEPVAVNTNEALRHFERLSRDEAENAALFAAAAHMGCPRRDATRVLTLEPAVWRQYQRAVRAAWRSVVRMREHAAREGADG